ncbi:bacillithiol biosynthesis cysteine-adding enzyme BshC [Thermoactinomyces sp. CICC 10523]|uniref:bacillithiol biosynthesis cysteine-adding enzyme BshC n=1 Tax=Thermoactinomyces sp. CICC 10523 TaxID=2767428 RepID=UPI0018DE59EC|nr:bacillithiol biosynthesis cysteine-adding enzyme BshC [Thermoactinomyces sp. CICC 10523]MBH8598050.1 bacillithiol biosynthesis cysteine-adding enzyme BshC [Thermoactinomyces sp. CICC 10523]
MKLETINVQEGTGLFHSYLENEAFVRSFYAYTPWEKESISKRVSYLDQMRPGLAAPRLRLVEALQSYLEPELSHPAVIRNLERLKNPDSLVVIGGQQAGLLSGPLYTIHKAITVIQWARRAEEMLNRPVIPVFWIAGEDHDFEEVNHIWIDHPENKSRKVKLEVKGKPKQPVSAYVLTPEETHSWLESLARLLPDHEHKKEWLDRMKQLIGEPLSWTRFFARVMHDFFGKWGLVLIDSADPGLRKLESPFFRELIMKSPRLLQHVAEKTIMLEQWGFPAPVELKDNQANLFILIDGERYPLYREGEVWQAGETGHRFTEAELLHLAETAPERFSNNVITRPLMQEYLFPVLFFVGGPGEIAYWGILREAFREMRLEMPIVLPREQLTLIDRLAEKRINDFSLSWMDVFSRLEEKRAQWLEERKPPELESRFLHAKESIQALHRRLTDELAGEIGMNMREMGRKNEEKVLAQIDYFYRFAKKAIETKHGAGLRQWDELIASVRPDRKPQERVYNVIQYWNLYGINWIDELVETSFVDIDRALRHHFVIL